MRPHTRHAHAHAHAHAHETDSRDADRFEDGGVPDLGGLIFGEEPERHGHRDDNLAHSDDELAGPEVAEQHVPHRVLGVRRVLERLVLHAVEALPGCVCGGAVVCWRCCFVRVF